MPQAIPRAGGPARRLSIRDLCNSLEPGPSTPRAAPSSTPLTSAISTGNPPTQASNATLRRIRRKQDEAAIRARYLNLHAPGFTFDSQLYGAMTDEEWMTAQQIWLEEEEAEAEERKRTEEVAAQVSLAEQGEAEEDGVEEVVGTQGTFDGDKGSSDLDLGSLGAEVTAPDEGDGPDLPITGSKRGADGAVDDVQAGPSKRPSSVAPGERRIVSPDSFPLPDAPSANMPSSKQPEEQSDAEDEWAIIDKPQDNSDGNVSNPSPMEAEDAGHDVEDRPSSIAEGGIPSIEEAGSSLSSKSEDDYVWIDGIEAGRAKSEASTGTATPTLDDDEDWQSRAL